MLDGVDPGADGVVDAGRAVGVGGDLQPQHVGLVDRRLHLLVGHLLGADAVALGEHPAGGAQLDQVGAVLVVAANHMPHGVRSVGHPISVAW